MYVWRQRELGEFLMHALNWAGVSLRADERVYVADESTGTLRELNAISPFIRVRSKTSSSVNEI